jgi:hypothetical protein
MDSARDLGLEPAVARAGGARLSADALRLRFVLASMGLVAGSNVLGALTHAGPRFAFASTAFTFFVMLAWTAWRRDPVLARWLLLGLIAGWLEIATDAWLVRNTRTLIYPQQEPMVWDSPLYMPFAWTLVLTQLGVLGGWLAQRMSLLKATLVVAALGGSMIPFYEDLARSAGYWWYQDTPMLMNAPLYIIVSEFLLSLPLVWMYRVAVTRPWGVSVLLGAFAGLWMVPSVMIAWWLVGPCQGAWVQFACR